MFLFLFIFYLLFGLVFYDLPYFQLVDEAFPLILFAYSLIKTKRIHKGLAIYFGIATFYIAYSFIIGSNVPQAILFDFIVISKPFLTLFSVMTLKPEFTKREQQIIRYLILAVIPVLVYAGIINEDETIEGQILSGARFSFCCIYLALTYYLFSKHRWQDLLTMSAIMALSFLGPTSKSTVTVILTITVFALSKRKKLKINAATIALAIIAVGAGIILTINDIQLYFSEGVARGEMYLAAGQILLDYIPFGSGFASFSTPAAATFYSHIYFDYSLDSVWGLSPDNPQYACDNFLPVLAEFGFTGIILFAGFFAYLYRFTGKRNTRSLYRICLIIPTSLLLEAISDISIIGNRGEFAMMLLGYAVAQINQRKYENTAHKQHLLPQGRV